MKNPHRQAKITAYRVTSLVLLIAILVMVAIPVIKDQNPSKVETASIYLETVGFKNPIYLGIKGATEGEYPTFQVECIGGSLMEVIIRTNPGGGMEIQPVSVPYFESILSAYAWLRIAVDAKLDKEYGNATLSQDEIDRNYKDMKPFIVPEQDYPSETIGWPSK